MNPLMSSFYAARSSKLGVGEIQANPTSAQGQVSVPSKMARILPGGSWLALLGCWGLGLSGFAKSSAPAAQQLVIEAKRVLALQREPEIPASGRYDWGPSVMKDGEVFKMWWTRLRGGKTRRFPYRGTLPDGGNFEFTYPDWGDRIYYAESRDGLTWHLEGDDYAGPPHQFGPEAKGPLLVLSPSESLQERNHLGNPSVIKVANIYYLYCEAPCEYALARDASGKVQVGEEYHNQIFVALSKDGRQWNHWPDHAHPQPILAAPKGNRRNARHRYGVGQPSACYARGKFILHYVDSCTGPGDFIVRIEADNPFFQNPRRFAPSLAASSSQAGTPAGAVARFAQTDVKYLGDTWCLVRPAYGTGNLGLLTSSNGLFLADAQARTPAEVFPQIRTPDPRGSNYLERLYPRFLTNPHGEILVQGGRVVSYYASGLGFKGHAYTWDLYRCEMESRLFEHAW